MTEDLAKQAKVSAVKISTYTRNFANDWFDPEHRKCNFTPDDS